MYHVYISIPVSGDLLTFPTEYIHMALNVDYLYIIIILYMCNCMYTGSFYTDTTAAALLEHNIYTLDKNQISVRAFQVIKITNPLVENNPSIITD